MDIRTNPKFHFPNGKRHWVSTEIAKRPYRLWDSVAKRDMPHRYYAIKRNALDGALLETRWAKVGTTIEVYDCRTGKLFGIFQRHPTTISFTKTA